MMEYRIQKICCIGAGYVGGPTMAIIADKCPEIEVRVVDINTERIDAWNDPNLSNLPVFEPGLDQVIARTRNRNLVFSTGVAEAIADADMIFLSVNTPTKTKGIGAGEAADLRWIEACTRQVATHALGKTIVVEKSTLPVRTAETIQSILNESKDETKSFAVLSNPEFLAEGTAIRDLEEPDRVLIGGDDEIAIESLAWIYNHWVAAEKILKTNLWSSELSKLTANAFLAQRVSSINSISAICEKTGANVNEVAIAIGTDSRIGKSFLKSGPGFGGSCFKKDILNLVYLSRHFGLEEVAEYWHQVLKLNEWQQKRIARSVVKQLFNTIAGKSIAILGFAFKANTNDTRESPAIEIASQLLNEGAHVVIHDPKVNQTQIKVDLQSEPGKGEGKWIQVDDPQTACNGADACLILTEWDMYRYLDWFSISRVMRKPAWLFDARAIADTDKAKAAGINVWRVGKGG